MAIELRPSLKFKLGTYKLPGTLTPPSIDITSDLVRMFNQGYTAILIFGSLQCTNQVATFTTPLPCLCTDDSCEIDPASEFNGVAYIESFDDGRITIRTGNSSAVSGSDTLTFYDTNEEVTFNVRDGGSSTSDYEKIACVIFTGTPYLAVVSGGGRK